MLLPGDRYDFGRGFVKDKVKAVEPCRGAAKAGDTTGRRP
jgi:hypothetical protein